MCPPCESTVAIAHGVVLSSNGGHMLMHCNSWNGVKSKTARRRRRRSQRQQQASAELCLQYAADSPD